MLLPTINSSAILLINLEYYIISAPVPSRTSAIQIRSIVHSHLPFTFPGVLKVIVEYNKREHNQFSSITYNFPGGHIFPRAARDVRSGLLKWNTLYYPRGTSKYTLHRCTRELALPTGNGQLLNVSYRRTRTSRIKRRRSSEP